MFDEAIFDPGNVVPPIAWLSGFLLALALGLPAGGIDARFSVAVLLVC